MTKWPALRFESTQRTPCSLLQSCACNYVRSIPLWAFRRIQIKYLTDLFVDCLLSYIFKHIFKSYTIQKISLESIKSNQNTLFNLGPYKVFMNVQTSTSLENSPETGPPRNLIWLCLFRYNIKMHSQQFKTDAHRGVLTAQKEEIFMYLDHPDRWYIFALQ